MKGWKFKNSLTAFLPTVPYVYVYMLQQVEYNGRDFLSWQQRMPDYRHVIRRKSLVKTKKALGLLALSYGFAGLLLVLIIQLVLAKRFLLAFATFLIWPYILALMLGVTTKLASFAINLKRRKNLALASEKLKNSKATRIMVLGSYGKTTTKEILSTVLGEGKRVAFSPGNMNVPISHARWVVNKLTGDEEVIIFEVGEGEPGDIEKFAKLLTPNIAVITGYAPNHLNKYKTEAALKADLESITKYVKPEDIYVASQANEKLSLPSGFKVYGRKGDEGLTVSNISNSFSGVKFDLEKGKEKLTLSSALIGEHNIDPLVLAFLLGKRFDLSDKQITMGVSKTKAFDHRMQPSHVNGAWIIDDTYNGNLEGIRAGLKLLETTDAKRKIYVTPGLVEQGEKTEEVHEEVGKLIAEANPDVVVLMENSVCEIIKKSLLEHGYKGELRIEEDPLGFYTKLQYEIATGDLILMQNDWTDNYN